MTAGFPDVEHLREVLRTYCIGEGIDTSVVNEALVEVESYLTEPAHRINRLHVRRIKVEGEVAFDRRFYDGVTAVYTPRNLRGKTTLLHVIKWAITGRNSMTEPVVNKVKRAWVELAADERVITVFLQREKRGTRSVTAGRIDECAIADWDEERTPAVPRATTQTGIEAMARGYFQELLGLSELGGTQRGAEPFVLRNSPIDLGGFFNVICVDQSEGYHILMDRMQPNRRRIFEAMLGLQGLPALWQLRSMEARLNAAVQRDEWLTEQRQSSQPDESAIGARAEEYRRLADEVELLLRQRSDLFSERKALVERLCKVGAVEEAQQATEELTTTQDVLYRTNEEVRILGRDVTRLERQMKALRGEIEANVVLSPVAPLLCPRCTRQLDETDVMLEASGQCRICHHDAPAADAEHQEQLQVKLAQLGGELEASKALLDERRQAATQLRQEGLSLSQRRARLITEAQRSVAEREIADDQKLIEVTEALSLATFQMNALREQLTPQERGELVESERTRGKRKVVTELLSRLEESQATEAAAIQKRFEDRMLAILNEIQVEEPADAIRFGDDYLPIVTVGAVEKRFNKNAMPAGQQARVAIAFHVALLLHSLDDVGRMPSFLLLDSPRQQEMSSEDFDGLCARLAEIGRRYSDRAQLVITSISHGILSIAPDDDHRIVPDGDGYIFPPCETPVQLDEEPEGGR